MNNFTLKRWISNHPKIYTITDALLNIYTEIRYIIYKSYTKDQEDKIVMKIFKEMYNMKISEIKYFDIGANNYKRGNNTWLFYKNGASGICVEADTFLCKKLKKRKKDIIVNAAITDFETNDSLKFYVCSLPTRSTLDKERAEKLKQEGLKIVNVLDIPCKTITNLCSETKIIPDYLSIDIEGLDFYVLKSIDFTKIPIKVIVAETDESKDESGTTMDDFMQQSGYTITCKTTANTIYVRNK